MHGGRIAYYVWDGERVVEEQEAAAAGPRAAGPVLPSRLGYGRFLARRDAPEGDRGEAMIRKLTELGECMNDPATCGPPAEKKQRDESDVPAGYTYLGQFITHEITFDDSNDTLGHGIDPHNLRTPQIDLDSLYGCREGEEPRASAHKHLYQADGVGLRIGTTSFVTPPRETFPNDLPRYANKKEAAREEEEGEKAEREKNPKKARIVDERNDENLAVAQTLVAFIRFHNRVVERLRAERHPDAGLFRCARTLVLQHFQWLILYDYLPRLVDGAVLKRVRDEGASWFDEKAVGPRGATMPLEFSAAAFRVGHTMVRATYDWNKYHDSERRFGDGPASVVKLFELTGFRKPRGERFDPSVDGFSTNSARPEGDRGLVTLPGDWVIDWRRFYEFPQAAGAPAQPRVNRASKLDTALNFQLDKLQGFPHAKTGRAQEVIKAITVRNLLRGYYLGLPTGEEVAEALGLEALKAGKVAEGPHEALLSDPLLFGRTPLWYYVLKEAELLGVGEDGTGGHRLGPVGSRIVAETFVGLVKHSPHSILKESGWTPRFGRPARGGEPPKFEMTDLLRFAFGDDEQGENSVNPVGP